MSDVLDQLRAFRPDVSAAFPDQQQSAVLDDILDSDGARFLIGRGERLVTTRAHRRRVWIPLVAAVAAVVLAAVVTVALRSSGSPHAPASSSPTFDSLAAAAAAQPPLVLADGQYLHVDINRTLTGVIALRTSAPPNSRNIYGTDTSDQQYFVTDDGHGLNRFHETLNGDSPTETYPIVDNPLAAPSAVDSDDLSAPRFVASLPTDVKQLSKILSTVEDNCGKSFSYSSTDGSWTETNTPPDVPVSCSPPLLTPAKAAIERSSHLLLDSAVSPAVTAAIIRVLEGLPGVTLAEGHTDETDQVAAIVSVQFDPDDSLSLYLDPDTGRLLEYVEVNSDGPYKNIVLDQGVVDSIPPK